MSPFLAKRRFVDAINGAAIALALASSTYGAWRDTSEAPLSASSPVDSASNAVQPTQRPDGTQTLTDASGHELVLKHFKRIVSSSPLADPLLLELCSPQRIVAFSGRAPLARDAHRYKNKPSIVATRKIEQLLELEPDLVLINSLGDAAWVQRVRDTGLAVFDLGHMRGLSTFLPAISIVGWLVGEPQAARRYAQHFLIRLNNVARHLDPGARRRALYVGIHGTKMYGGTRGSSFHDVLTHAGLIDAATDDYEGWPTYTPEQLVMLNPEVIVTQPTMRATLCDRQAFGALAACNDGGQVIEIETALLSDAGAGMLETAELVHEAAYGRQSGKGL